MDMVGYYNESTGETLCLACAEGRDKTGWGREYALNGTDLCSCCGRGLEDE